MEPHKIIAKHKRITDLVIDKRVKRGLDLTAEFAALSSKSDHRNQQTNLEITYRNMIKYTAGGIQDPERDKVFHHLLQSILKLADEIKQDLLSQYSGWHTYWLKNNSLKEQKLSGKTIVENINDLTFKRELDDWLKESGTRFSETESELPAGHQKLIDDIFNHLWLADHYGDAEEELINIIRNSDHFPWYEQSIFVSAITLSTLRSWELKKVRYLIDIYKNGIPQIRERAMAGLVMVLQYWDKRITLYPGIIAQLQQLSDDKGFKDQMRITVLQIIKSRETEQISKKLHDEILPKVASLRPKIEEKLDLDSLLPEDLIEGKNPDWSDMFKDSEDIFKTMEEFSKLQMEGADVYMSAFANLKNFDFFRTFSNWFLPFHPDHETLNEIFRDEILGEGTNELAEALYKTPFICNSDKYSLILNLKHLPDAQKNMMLKVFRMELEGMEQVRDNEIDLDPNLTFKTHITQYMQDLYRFFKLSPYKNEFEDIFRGIIDIYNSEFYKLIFADNSELITMADYFFGKDFYDDALTLYIKALEVVHDDPQLCEKAGYCYQQRGEYENAIKMYKRSDIFERKVWTMKKIGYSLRRSGKIEEALQYYLDAESEDKDNMHTNAMIGHCYLDMKNYEMALKYYFKVEYSDPGNIRVLRPIAWCYFVTGEFNKSKKYYEKLSSVKLTGHDQINFGHLHLCMGERQSALDCYKKSIIEGNIEREDFIDIFEDDRAIITEHGIDPDDLSIIIDYIFYELDS